MSEGNTVADDTRPDLSGGFPIQELTAHRVVAGRVGDDDVIVVRHADALLAVAGRCTHYGGPLATGLVVGDTIRCPLHHACFSLRTDEALRAPALDALARWRVEQVGDTVYVREQCPPTGSTHATSNNERTDHPGSVVIVGAGAAGVAAADMLRREGFRGSLTMLSAESDRPCDRPNLSKDYLAGNASDEWMPLRPAAFYAEHAIDLRLDSRVSSLELSERRVRLESGRCIPFDALLLATGADAVRLDVHGATPSQIHTLRVTPTAARSSRRRARLDEPWSSGRVSLVWKSRPRCASVGSRCTWSGARSCPWSVCWVRSWASPYWRFIKHMVWCFISVPHWRKWTTRLPCSATAAASQQTWL
jgi:nitrite reductase/ring-hydroxylating ferredoxin subunit